MKNAKYLKKRNGAALVLAICIMSLVMVVGLSLLSGAASLINAASSDYKQMQVSELSNSASELIIQELTTTTETSVGTLHFAVSEYLKSNSNETQSVSAVNPFDGCSSLEIMFSSQIENDLSDYLIISVNVISDNNYSSETTMLFSYQTLKYVDNDAEDYQFSFCGYI